MRIWKFLRFIGVMVLAAARMSVGGRRLAERERYRYVARIQCMACKSLCKILGVTVRLNGEFDRDRASLIIANHTGILDPWILASQMRIAFAAKAEMSSWPVFGWIGRSAGLIFVDRQHRMKTESFVEEVQRRMRYGVGVLVFPEGTTSDGAELLPFKTGAFESVAGMSDGYVQPLYLWAESINGARTNLETRKLITWPAGVSMVSNAWKVFALKKICIRIDVGEAISTADRDRKSLARASEEIMQKMHLQSRS